MILFSGVMLFVGVLFGEPTRDSGKVCLMMGPSCAGKSTLSLRVCEALGDDWVFVGLDEILETKEESEGANFDEKRFAMDYLAEGINEPLGRGKNVIVDTNMFEERLLDILENWSEIFYQK